MVTSEDVDSHYCPAFGSGGVPTDTCFYNYDMMWLCLNTHPFTCRAKALTDCATAADVGACAR